MGAYEPRKSFGKQVGVSQFDLGEIVTAGALNAAVVSSEMETSGFTKLAVFVDYTRNTGTAVRMTSEDAFADTPVAADWYRHEFVDDSAPPTHETGEALWQRTAATSGRWVWVVDVVGNKTRLTFTAAVGSITDLVTVQAVGIA